MQFGVEVKQNYLGDQFALFSAARQSANPTTSATVTPRAFACGCAALSHLCWL
jgi:hypothetical protein